MGVTTAVNCRTLISDPVSVIGRWYQLTDENSDDKYKKTLIYIVLLIFFTEYWLGQKERHCMTHGFVEVFGWAGHEMNNGVPLPYQKRDRIRETDLWVGKK